MSIFKLKNLTGLDSFQEWCNYTFPNNQAIDLLNTENLKIDLSDIIGIKNGVDFENIRSLIKTNQWKLNDGDQDLSQEDALHLLKYGTPATIRARVDSSGHSGVALKSHNLANQEEWTNGECKFVVTPDAGRSLSLSASKVMIDDNFVADDSMYFRVFVGDLLVRQDLYESTTDLLLGCTSFFKSDKIGDVSSNGSPALIHIRYSYTEPIVLKSSLGMRLEIGFLNNRPPKSKNSILQIRLEGSSLKE